MISVNDAVTGNSDATSSVAAPLEFARAPAASAV